MSWKKASDSCRCECPGVADLVLSGFLRIVTHPRVFDPPSLLDDALRFVDKDQTAAQLCGTWFPTHIWRRLPSSREVNGSRRIVTLAASRTSAGAIRSNRRLVPQAAAEPRRKAFVVSRTQLVRKNARSVSQFKSPFGPRADSGGVSRRRVPSGPGTCPGAWSLDVSRRLLSRPDGRRSGS